MEGDDVFMTKPILRPLSPPRTHFEEAVLRFLSALLGSPRECHAPTQLAACQDCAAAKTKSTLEVTTPRGRRRRHRRRTSAS